MDSTDTGLPGAAETGAAQAQTRRKRADAQRNLGALLEAAKTIFATSGVDAPAKAITDLAGVGVGTLYRHFPRRSDLVAAVLQREVDACADAGAALSAEFEPRTALVKWIQRFTEFVGTKRGLAAALHSGDPAFDALPGYFRRRVEPVVTALLAAAIATGEIRSDVTAHDLMNAVVLLCQPVHGEEFSFNQRMVALFIDGLRPSKTPGPVPSRRSAGNR
jgi:AcrR family transcriptional regulator